MGSDLCRSCGRLLSSPAAGCGGSAHALEGVATGGGEGVDAGAAGAGLVAG